MVDGIERNIQNRKFCFVCSPFGKHNTRDITKPSPVKNNWHRVTSYRRRLKQKLIDYKGGKCERCGYDKLIPSAYDFHHREPSKKKFGIANNLCKSLNILKKEVDKCDLLCCRCHAEVHYELEMSKVKS